MIKKQTLPDVSYIQKMFNKHNYNIGIRDVHADGDKGYFFMDCDSFIETCNDYSLNPLEVFKTLEKDVVYIIHKDIACCEYFILWDTKAKLSYGMSYTC